MNRFDCAGSSGSGFGLRGIGAAYTEAAHSSNGSRNWRGSSSARARNKNAISAGYVVDAQRDPVVVAEIKLGCVAVQAEYMTPYR